MRMHSVLCCIAASYITSTQASVGDQLPEFQTCVSHCINAECTSRNPQIPLHRRLLLWDCPSECDYACQHIVTQDRLTQASGPTVQFHGKWPFYRFLGVQEPASVIFSLLNFVTHYNGLQMVLRQIPASYSLRPYYVLLSCFGLSAWTWSMVFHTRDFKLTERLDYFGAGAYVLYLMYLACVRLFRLDQEAKAVPRTALTVLCSGLYLGHVSFLSFWRFDYTYNMMANVVVGLLQDVLWIWFAVGRYQKVDKLWALWPAVIVMCVSSAMSLELFDFAPWLGAVDAHSLWHLATIVPTVWWYDFLVLDATDDISRSRRKD